ncbi:hypothetical protein IGI04_005894, partial [Brassica rapa subsp. trilocularis]
GDPLSSPVKSTASLPAGEIELPFRCNPSSVSDIAATEDMDLEPPKRLYGEGLEPQVKKINNCCRMELLGYLKEAMSANYDDVKIDLVFKHII